MFIPPLVTLFRTWDISALDLKPVWDFCCLHIGACELFLPVRTQWSSESAPNVRSTAVAFLYVSSDRNVKLTLKRRVLHGSSQLVFFYIWKVVLKGGTSSWRVSVAFQGWQTVLTLRLPPQLTRTSLVGVLAFAGSMNITHAWFHL